MQSCLLHLADSHESAFLNQFKASIFQLGVTNLFLPLFTTLAAYSDDNASQGSSVAFATVLLSKEDRRTATMGDAHYLHAALYRFTTEASKALISEYKNTLQNVSARCSYDREHHVSWP